MPGAPYALRDAGVAVIRARRAFLPLSLIRLIRAGEAAAFRGYLELSRAAVAEAGGRRVYAGSLDGGPARDPIHRFDTLLVDDFDCGVHALRALEHELGRDGMGVRDVAVLACEPAPGVVQRFFGRASRVASAVAGVRLNGAPPLSRSASVGEPGLDAAVCRRFDEQSPEQPLSILNLMRYRDWADYRDPIDRNPSVPGEEAYGRYGRRALPALLRRGGRPIWLGTPRAWVVGQGADVLMEDWDAAVLIQLPSRLAMRDVVASAAWRAAAPHRSAGLDGAVVMPGAPWHGEQPPVRDGERPALVYFSPDRFGGSG